jgi:hypothetical protein
MKIETSPFDNFDNEGELIYIVFIFFMIISLSKGLVACDEVVTSSKVCPGSKPLGLLCREKLSRQGSPSHRNRSKDVLFSHLRGMIDVS